MGSSPILLLISLAESCFLPRLISRRGILSSLNRKLYARLMSTTSSVNSDESIYGRPSSTISPPWLMLPPALKGGDMAAYRFYSLAENKVVSLNKRSGKEEPELESADDDAKIVGSSHGWLVQQRNRDLFLSNPLSRRHIKLPPLPEITDDDVSKVIISCSPDEEECRAMMSFGGGDRLAFCLPGRSTEWTPIGASSSEVHPSVRYMRVYHDFVYCSIHKLFICVTECHIKVWDLGDPLSPRTEIKWMPGWAPKGNYPDSDLRIKWMQENKLRIDDEENQNYPWSARYDQLLMKDKSSSSCIQLNYLVSGEQSNQLFLVKRHIVKQNPSYPYKTIGFDVYKIDRETGKLKFMEDSLDGVAMFIGINHSFLVMSAAEFPQLKPNSIYFTYVNEFTQPDYSVKNIYGGHDIGIFDFENRTISPIACDYQSMKKIVPPPIWFTPTTH